MNQLDSIMLTEHNDRVAAVLVWLLDRNAPIMALGFRVSDNTARLIRELRAEIHGGAEYQPERGSPCRCKRCLRKIKAANKKARASRVA